ncbi:40-residue YVTN family beta-propeller repeat-containing protein [Paenibacillus algorifonticola]|uniref:40-residue YVTN family beta-propeller repeat-containing protein n=1 Tax=Paenibacillus algorifonticola TaxID=684063 RepID=A0A1I2DN15_9BACL|nr:S-layer homology domain-containing protein [Paenibacillus algorifonticola]SFE81799.1 40-residue YVTN family beta-propeller repeat-containing protein [Paenibacillus algorifonticola]
MISKFLRKTWSMTLVIAMLVSLFPGGPAAQASTTGDDVFKKAYITSFNTGKIDVVDLTNNTVQLGKITAGRNPNSAAINPNGTQVFVTNRSSATVSVIDPGTDTVIKTINVGSSPLGVAFTPDGTKAYVAEQGNGGSISIIDTNLLTVVKTIPGFNSPTAMVIVDQALYVTESSSSQVSIINTTQDIVSGTIAVGSGPYGLSANPAGTKLYVANQSANSVSVVNLDTQTVEATIAVGASPTSTEVSPDGSRVYSANSGSNTISVIDTSNNTVISTINVGTGPFVVGALGDGSRVYSINYYDSSMSVIDTSNNTVIQTINLSSGPFMVGTFMVPTAVVKPPAEPPVISVQPESTTVDEGSNGSFSVTATGSNLTYQWQIDNGTGFENISDQTSATLALSTVSSLLNGNQYRVVVTGTGNLSVTSSAASLTVRTAPQAPAIIGTSAGDTSVILSWNPVNDATSYQIYQSVTSNTYGSVVATVSSSDNHATITGLTSGTTYYYAVTAVKGALESAYSNQVSATPQVPAPGAPVLKVPTAFNEKVTLSWDPVEGATGYKIYKSLASSTQGSLLDTVSGSVYSYDATGLTNGSTYYFVVMATNPGGDSEGSNQVSATPMTIPTAPLNIVATGGNQQAVIRFDVPASNGGSAITGYEVSSSPETSITRGTSSPITVTGLQNGVSYTFTVKAINAVGEAASTASNAVIPQAPSGGGGSTSPAVETKDPIKEPEKKPDALDIFRSDVVQSDHNVVKNITTLVQNALQTPVKAEFSDTTGHWAEKTLSLFAQLNVIKGYEDHTIKPNAPITRAEFAAIISRVFDIQNGSKDATVMKDVSGHWAKEEIEKLSNAGILNGYEDQTFRPDNTISREEMVVILARIVNFANVTKDSSKGTFADVSDSYASDQIREAAQAGIIIGKNSDSFEPKGASTRAEALTVILNTLNLNQQVKTLLDSLNR